MTGSKKILLIRAMSLLLSISIAFPGTACSLPEKQLDALRVPVGPLELRERQQDVQRRLFLKKYNLSRFLTQEEVRAYLATVSEVVSIDSGIPMPIARIQELIEQGKASIAEKHDGTREVVMISSINAHLEADEQTVGGVTYMGEGDESIIHMFDPAPVFDFTFARAIRDRYLEGTPLSDSEGKLAAAVYRVRQLLGEEGAEGEKSIQELIEMVDEGNVFALVALEVKGALFSIMKTLEERGYRLKINRLAKLLGLRYFYEIYDDTLISYGQPGDYGPAGFKQIEINEDEVVERLERGFKVYAIDVFGGHVDIEKIEIKPPQFGHSEKVADAYTVIQAESHDEAYDLVMEGLLGEDSVVNVETAIGILQVLSNHYGLDTKRGQEIAAILPIVIKHQETTDQTQMKKELGQVMSKPEATEVARTASLQDIARDLLEQGSVTITAEDGKQFTFRLKIIRDWYIVTTDGGYFDFRLGVADYGYMRQATDSFAIEVYNPDYKGLGRALVSLALFISKEKGRTSFAARSSTADSFWIGLGFRKSGSKDFIFNLGNSPIPPIKIVRKGSYRTIPRSILFEKALKSPPYYHDWQKKEAGRENKAIVEDAMSIIAQNPGSRLLYLTEGLTDLVRVESSFSGTVLFEDSVRYTADEPSRAIGENNEKLSAIGREAERVQAENEGALIISRSVEYDSFSSSPDNDLLVKVLVIREDKPRKVERVEAASDFSVNLNELKQTVVLFSGDGIMSNPDGFIQALNALDENNTAVVLTDLKQELREFCRRNKIDRTRFLVRTPAEIGLSGFDLDQVMSLVVGIDNLRCVPLTDSLCNTYEALKTARDQV
ncbi:hypothetical protein ACFL0P_04085 [Candidatus Omnitrophota bacterium]